MAQSADEHETFTTHFARMLSSLEAGDFNAARQHALTAAAAAEAMNDINRMLQAADHLERFNKFGIAGRLMAHAGRVIAQTVRTEWDGTDMPRGTLLIEQRIRDIGSSIRNARLVRIAGKRVNRCIVLINPRLVSLYRRSFPGVDIRARGIDDEKARNEADAVASFETLWQHLTPDSATVAATFSPLRPDTDLVRRLRERTGPMIHAGQ